MGISLEGVAREQVFKEGVLPEGFTNFVLLLLVVKEEDPEEGFELILG